MNIDSFKNLDPEEREIFEKIYLNLYEGCPLSDGDFKVLEKAYNEITSRMSVK